MIKQLLVLLIQKKINNLIKFKKIKIGDKNVFPYSDISNLKKIKTIYLHIPFCETLCSYCSFNRILYNKKYSKIYFQSLRNELHLYKNMNFNFSTVYIGGGTPTINLNELEKTIFLLYRLFNIKEISIETNPNHLNFRILNFLKNIGINRLSVGVQSFDDKILLSMNRYEIYGNSFSIISNLEKFKYFFPTLNIDMIFNFPLQTELSLINDLEIIKKLNVNQVTFYPFMDNNTFKKKVEKKNGKLDLEQEEIFYKKILQYLLPQYKFSSIWCFSQKESMIDEYIINNQNYIGVGSGAISYINNICYVNTFDIDKYIFQIEQRKIPIIVFKKIPKSEQIKYSFLMSLLQTKLDPQIFKKNYKNFYLYIWILIIPLYFMGFFNYKNNIFTLTKNGRYFALTIMKRFFIAINNLREFCRKY